MDESWCFPRGDRLAAVASCDVAVRGSRCCGSVSEIGVARTAISRRRFSSAADRKEIVAEGDRARGSHAFRRQLRMNSMGEHIPRQGTGVVRHVWLLANRQL